MDNKCEKYSLIDLMKLFFAFGILCLHTGINQIFPSTISFLLLKLWYRMGVPFFFVVSGFFLSNKLSNCSSKDDKAKIVKDTFLKFIKPLFVFGCIGLIQAEVKSILSYGLSESMIKNIHDSLFYPKGGMWFVEAIIIGTAIVCLMHKHIRISIILAIASYGFALIANSYYWVVSDTVLGSLVQGYMTYFVSARNGIFVGFPLMLSGYLSAKFLNRKDNRTNNRVAFVGTISFIIYILEIIICRNNKTLDDQSIYLSTPFCVVSILYFAYNAKSRIDKSISLKLREWSKYLYYFHPVYNDGIATFLISRRCNNIAIQFAFVFILCLLTIVVKNKSTTFRKFIDKII